MSKVIFELQNNIKNLRQQLNDRIHLAFLNHQSYLCLKTTLNPPFKEISSNIHPDPTKISSNNQKSTNIKQPSTQNQTSIDTHQHHTIIQTKLKNISQIFQKRSQNHLNYLIIKQIQSEQQCVRRDRLTEYQQRIYDQRRLISDKEVFTESLLRPKKQRPEYMNSEQFQEVRAVERVEEEKAKITFLEEEVKTLQSFRKKICESEIKNSRRVSNAIILKSQIEIYGKLKSQDLQRTKAHSLETVNMSNMNNIYSEKAQKPFEEEQFNSEISIRNQNEGKNLGVQKTKVLEEGLGSQKVIEKDVSGCYSVYIQKLIQSYEKKATQQEMKQKYKKISELLNRIKEKKQQNVTKSKQWKGLEMQNAHMRAHLNKTKQIYLQHKLTHSKCPNNNQQIIHSHS